MRVEKPLLFAINLVDERRTGAKWAGALPNYAKGECEMIWLLRNIINQHITSCKRKVRTPKDRTARVSTAPRTPSGAPRDHVLFLMSAQELPR